MAKDAYSFELAWRWTSESHNVFPPEVMAQIQPLERAERPHGVTPEGKLDASEFNDIRTTRADVSTEKGTAWLRQLPVDPAEQIIVTWGEDTAVRTTWEIFTQYWDDFCYPASDDVDVYPQSGKWLLFYMHEEVFQWGSRREA